MGTTRDLRTWYPRWRAAFTEIDITAPQPEPFAGTEPRSVQDESSVRYVRAARGIAWRSRAVAWRALEFLVGVNVRLECACGAWARLLQRGGGQITTVTR